MTHSLNTAEYMAILHRSGDTYEIRSLNCPSRVGHDFVSTHSGYFQDTAAMIGAIRSLEMLEPPGTYVTINPVLPALLARSANRMKPKARNTTKDSDIVERRWMLLDIDAVRASGTSSTDAEQRATLDLAEHIRDVLAADGWPDAMLCMSGNGAYLMYRIELPNDDVSTDLIKRVLLGLAKLFDTDMATVDTATFNASRIHKIPGTTARKGDNLHGIPGVDDRPHRIAWFEPPVAPINPVPVDLLELVAYVEPPRQTTPTVPASNNGGGPLTAVERASRYVAKMEIAVEGSNGSDRAFAVACALVIGFGLSVSDARPVFEQWSDCCEPPWSDGEITHKLESAAAQAGERGHLLNAEKNQLPVVPDKKQPPKDDKPAARDRIDSVSLEDVAIDYLADKTVSGSLIDFSGIPEVNHALGGGVELGEMVVIAALTSHGKTAFSLQCLHTSARNGMAGLFVCEDMPQHLIGKRTLQYVSPIPTSEWNDRQDDLKQQVARHFASLAKIHVVSNCRTATIVEREVERAIKERGVSVVVVDYLQCLAGEGHKYEQVSEVSACLRRITSKNNVLMIALAQLNRSLGTRDKCIPRLADLRDSGQIEQDADVVMFLVKPYELDKTRDEDLLQIFIPKNRNRETVNRSLSIRFNGARQLFTRRNVTSDNECDIGQQDLEFDEGIPI